MCNNCECENSYLCSIVGHLHYGACCEKCVNYDERNTCLHYISQVIKPKAEDMVMFEVLPEPFRVKTGITLESGLEKSVELYP